MPGSTFWRCLTSANMTSVVAAGEQVTAGLLAVALGAHRRPGALLARLADPDPDLRGAWLGPHRGHRCRADERAAWRRAQVAVVAGFQGVAPRQSHLHARAAAARTLSAVAVAAGLRADRCDIYTDVDGVYTTDPRIVPKARRLEKIAYEEMLEMASLGAKVLQTRSVEIAMLHRVPDSRAFDLRPRRGRHASLRRGRHRGKETGHRHRLYRATKRRSRCTRSRTGPASPPPSSDRWPMPASTST